MAVEDRLYRTVVDALARDQLTLPTLPEVALRIGDMSRRDDVSIAALAAELAKDPAMTVRLLRVANSASSQPGRRIDNLAQAITRLGLQMTRLLVTGLAVEHLFVSRSPFLQERLRQTWQHSVEVAALAQVLARHCTVLKPELAMLGGLVHAVGVLPIVRLAEQHAELCASPAELDSVIKRLRARVGRLVLQAWQFPEVLADVPGFAEDLYRAHGGPAEYVDVVIVAVLQTYGHRDPLLARVDRNAVAAFARLDLSPDVTVLEIAEYQSEFSAGCASLAA